MPMQLPNLPSKVKIREIKNIPDVATADRVVIDFKLSDALDVKKILQHDGNYTVVAQFSVGAS